MYNGTTATDFVKSNGTYPINTTVGFAGTTHGFQLFKSGPINAGTVVSSGTVASWNFGNLPALNMVLSNDLTIIVAACITPDVKVPLGSHPKSAFSGTGSTTAAVSFNIALNACPAGMNSIQFRIDPVTSVVNSGLSVVALDSSSSATGVGVQLLDGVGAVFPLSTQKTFSGYNGGTGGSYTIPMKARYYQTGISVSGGAANTSMTFTMAYE